MSKTVISIKVSELPQSVLKKLLPYCNLVSLRTKHDSNENQQSVDFLYNYNIELSREQSDAIVFFASKQDVEKERAEREELRNSIKRLGNESTRKKAAKPEAPQDGDTSFSSSPERT